jgi:acetoacetate decarboxylase
MIDASCTGHEADTMTEADVPSDAFAMPLTNPAYPTGPYRFVDHE